MPIQGTFTATVASAQKFLSVRDAVFPILPFSGLLSVARDRGWRLQETFPSFEFDVEGCPLPGQCCNYAEAREIILRSQHKAGAPMALQSGARKSVASLGVMGPGMLAHATLGDAMKFGLQYQGIAGSMLHLTLETNETEAAVVPQSLFNDDELKSFLHIDHLLVAANAINALPCEHRAPVRFEVEGCGSSEMHALLPQIVGCEVRFYADRTRLVYERTQLDSPLRFPNSAAAAIWRQACQKELKALGLDNRVALDQHLFQSDGRLRSRQDIAERMGLSERTLYRMLANEGVHYFELADMARMSDAKRFLRLGHTTEEIAEMLGYSDSRSFRRAFRRATDQSPSQYRDSH